MDIETVAIREWKGCWQGEEKLAKQTVPAGGYVITFHKNFDGPYKAEHYNTIEEIQAKYPEYIWMMPDPRDPADIVLVGI